MSTAAKITNSTRLKLKEAQEEIGALRLALAAQQLASPKDSSQESSNGTMESPEDTPEGKTKDKTRDQDDPMETEGTSTDTTREKAAAEKLGSDLIEQIMEAQAVGAALAKKHRAQIRADKDAMEEDERSPITIGSSSSSSLSSSSSSLSSSSSSSSSSNSKSNDSTSKDLTIKSLTSTSTGTKELVQRLQQNTQEKTKETKIATTTKNIHPAEDKSGAKRASAKSQAMGKNSGSKGAHQIPAEPSGTTGGLNKDAGLGD
jgi:hypothetical protein